MACPNAVFSQRGQNLRCVRIPPGGLEKSPSSGIKKRFESDKYRYKPRSDIYRGGAQHTNNTHTGISTVEIVKRLKFDQNKPY